MTACPGFVGLIAAKTGLQRDRANRSVPNPVPRVVASSDGLAVRHGSKRATKLQWWMIEGLSAAADAKWIVTWPGGTVELDAGYEDERRIVVVVKRLLRLRERGWLLPNEPEDRVIATDASLSRLRGDSGLSESAISLTEEDPRREP